MAYDNGIFNYQNSVQIDPLASYQKGLTAGIDNQAAAMRLSDLARQNTTAQQGFEDQQNMRQALASNVTQDAQGNNVVNQPAAVSALAAKSPMAAMDLQKTFGHNDLDKMATDTARAKNYAFSILPDGSNYDEVRQKAIADNLPNADKLPDVFVPTVVKNWQMGTLSGEQQIQAAQKQKEMAMEQQKMQLEYGQKLNDKNENEAQKLNDHLDTGWTKRSGAASTVQAKINAAEAAEKLIEQGKTQEGGLDSRQIEELAQNTGTLLGGGSSASARVNALVPHTLLGRAQSAAEWATGSPRGQDQQEFVDRMADTIAREKAVAQAQKKDFQQAGLPAYAQLKTRNPEQFNAILKSHGLDPASVDARGLPIAGAQPAAPAHPQDEAAIAWAKANPGPKADAILKANGVR